MPSSYTKLFDQVMTQGGGSNMFLLSFGTWPATNVLIVCNRTHIYAYLLIKNIYFVFNPTEIVPTVFAEGECANTGTGVCYEFSTILFLRKIPRT